MRKMKTTNKLSDIAAFQVKLQKALNGIELPCDNICAAKEYAVGIFTELGEALAVNKNWKTWTANKPYDVKALREEIADIWIFLINYTLANNMTIEEVLFEIGEKQKILALRHSEKLNNGGKNNE